MKSGINESHSNNNRCRNSVVFRAEEFLPCRSLALVISDHHIKSGNNNIVLLTKADSK